jgi:tRNA A-37 threonylcarbamoyl transferase component Bud32
LWCFFPMTSDGTRLEDDTPVEEERTRLEGSDPNETVLEGGASKRSESLGLVGRTFESTEKSYQVLEELEASGAEADIYVVEEQESEDKRVLKYYRRGIRPKAEITEMLAGLDKEHVVQVYETGVNDGRSYEIQEFVEHGSLADMVTWDGLPDDRIKEILHELLIALEHLHENKVIHRDLKPANVLVRTLDPLDLVFIDFGISSQTDHSLHATSTKRTVAYASPEALTGVVAKASDWWSVGVTLLELLTGKHPFAGLNEQTVNFQLVSKGIELPSGIAGDWQLLLKGLLTRDREKRWDAKQVREWLEGDRSMATGYDADHAEERETKKYDYRPYRFNGREIYELAELARAFGENWQQGVKDFGRGLLTEWLREKGGDQERVGLLMDVQEDHTLDADLKLSVVLLCLDGSMPLVFRGDVLTRENLARFERDADLIFKSNLGVWLARMEKEQWFVRLSVEYRELAVSLHRYQETIESNAASHLFVSSDKTLNKSFRRLRSKIHGSSESSLNNLLQKRKLGRIEKIIILCAKRNLLLKREPLWPSIKKSFLFRLTVCLLIGIAFWLPVVLALNWFSKSEKNVGPVGVEAKVVSPQKMSGHVGLSINYSVKAQGVERPLFSAINLPSGISLDEKTGFISGIPVQSGTFKTKVIAKNKDFSSIAEKTYIFKILPIPIIPPGKVVVGFVGLDLKYHIKAGSLIKPRFSATNLPSGLSLHERTGVIVGTPTELGKSEATIKVEIEKESIILGKILFKVFSLPILTSLKEANGYVGRDFRYRIMANHQTDSLYTVTSLPLGLEFAQDTGVISGIPKQKGVTLVNINIKTGNQSHNIGTLKINIYKPINPPVVGSLIKINGQVGSRLQFKINSFGGTIESYNKSNLPPGLLLDKEKGLLTGIPRISGVFETMVRLQHDNLVFTDYPVEIAIKGKPWSPGSNFPQRATKKNTILKDQKIANSPNHFKTEVANINLSINKIIFTSDPHRKFKFKKHSIVSVWDANRQGKLARAKIDKVEANYLVCDLLNFSSNSGKLKKGIIAILEID